jgi:hypothetical protein
MNLQCTQAMPLSFISRQKRKIASPIVHLLTFLENQTACASPSKLRIIFLVNESPIL